MGRAKTVVVGGSIEAGTVRMLSPAVVSKSLGIAKRTFFRMLSEKKFPPADLRMGSKLPRWRAETLERWVQENAAK